MRANRRLLPVLCAVLGLTVSATALAAIGTIEGIPIGELLPGARFDTRIPTQSDFLGFEPGTRPMRHPELIRYLEELDRRSPRAELETYSKTHEGRPMVVFIVSDETTMRDPEAFRIEHARRMDPREPAAAALENAKAVAWMAYGIHGDELTSVDAAAALAYWLVAGEDDLARRLRAELVILIDPCENPDGRERFLAQTTSFAHLTPNPDPEDLSHTTVWPWGRGNHYLFDLNRDWFSLVQPESRRSIVIASWSPQLMVDSHEMGSHDTYLMSPPRHPFNPHLPEFDAKWGKRFAADQARALDGRGYTYYTREWNEEFFPGYGSSWAAYLGATGILYEMSGTEGTLVHQRSGVVRTFAEGVEHQLTSSVANLTTLADNRRERLADFREARRQAVRDGTRGKVGAWVLPQGKHPDRTVALVDLLRSYGVEVLQATDAPPKVSGLRDARTGEEVAAGGMSANTWMVPLDQPMGKMVRVLLDPHVPMDAEFFREEREYLERGQKSRLYEITAWSLPLAYGIEAYWTHERPSDGWKERPVTRHVGNVVSGEDPLAFVMEGQTDAATGALADLLQRGIVVHLAGRPFRVSEYEYPRGSVLIRLEGNPDDTERTLHDVAARWGVRIAPTPTSLAEEGADLGGRHFHRLITPRVGIWTGAPVSPPSYGALWHLLDQGLALRFSGLDVSRASRTDLSRYNVLVFPPIKSSPGAYNEIGSAVAYDEVFGSPSAYNEVFGEAGIKRLKEWVRSGGTAIGIGSGAMFLADEKIELTRTRARRQALDRHPPVVLGPDPALIAEQGGAFRAVGVRVPQKKDDGDQNNDGSRRDDSGRASVYDVAPILGAGAAPFAEGVDQGTPVSGAPVDLAEWLVPFLPPGKAEPDADDLARGDKRLRRFAPKGAFLRVDLDPQLWSTWGTGDLELPALIRGTAVLLAESPVDVPARYADVERLHLGGLLWPEAAGRIARTAYMTREAVGRGQVILFPHEPEFRGWTLGTRRLLVNALLYGPGMGTRWSSPW